MTTNTKELNEKLAKWAGFTHTVHHTEGYHVRYNYPDGTTDDRIKYTLPDFTSSLDACFKWLVPKFRSVHPHSWIDISIVGAVTTGVTTFIINIWDSPDNSTAGSRDTNAALSLCLAIEKLIDSEAKVAKT